MRKSALLAKGLYNVGASRALDLYWGRQRLTVLTYHRICDVTAPDFDLYQPNVSAAPKMFARQIDYVVKHFHVIDLTALHAYIEHGKPLPPRPLLITFDDGYLDNYQNAFPVLRSRGVPAVIFLMTSRMDNPTLPWWDECAYYFYHTKVPSAVLPLIGERDLSTLPLRLAAREALLPQLKQIAETDKLLSLNQLSQALQVALPTTAPPLFVSWEQVRELVANGVACQPHSVTHPIMTRISDDEVRRQLADSKAHIERETNQHVTAFAYPNGRPGDYSETTIQALRETGYTLAFTLLPGPMRLDEVKQHPLEIKRVFLGYQDTFELFVMKILGLPTLISRMEV